MVKLSAAEFVRHNLQRLQEDIVQAAQACGRTPEEITLVAVSKTHPVEMIAAAQAWGQQSFGENTVQEALPKIDTLAPQGLVWHFIGHLQSNKAKYIPAYFAWLHSLDSLALAQRLARFSQARSTPLNVLLEVNISGDPAKHGVSSKQVLPLLESLLANPLPGLHLRGLMTIGPYPAEEAQQRQTFAALRALREHCQERFALPSFNQLSMGMSGDYIAAVKEGATLLRIGSAIFGERSYP